MELEGAVVVPLFVGSSAGSRDTRLSISVSISISIYPYRHIHPWIGGTGGGGGGTAVRGQQRGVT